MVSFDPIVRVLNSLTSLVEGKPDLRWAVVTQISPLRIRLDADENELLATPDTLVSPLLPGERVRVALQNRRVTVLGVAGRRTDLRGTTAMRTLVGSSGELVNGLRFFDTDENCEYVWRVDQWSRYPQGVYGLVTPSPGWTLYSGHAHKLSRVGDLCRINVTLVNSSGGIADIGSVPPEFRPTQSTFIGFSKAGSTTLVGAVFLTASGNLSIPYYTGTAGSGNYFPIAGTWHI